MAEEDLIFGKNRHFFGGIEPDNMKAFSAKIVDGKVQISAELPSDTVVDGQTLCTVKGAVIRRKTNSYPQDEFDGELVADIKTSPVEFVDTEASADETDFYAAFPYTTQGVYNRNKANCVIAKKKNYTYVFGYDLDIADPNPATRVHYPDDVDNANFVPAKLKQLTLNKNDFGFDYGGWSFEPGEKFMPRPCMLTYDGVVDHYLDPNDYTKKIDGTASSVADTSFNGNAMMEWPKIYTKRWEEDGVYHFRCSDIPQDDDWDCWCNYDINDNQIDHFYTAIYQSILSDNKFRSLSGSVSDYGTASECITYAKANGDDWYIEQLADRMLIHDLLIMMSCSTDIGLAFGRGYTDTTAKGRQSNGAQNLAGMFIGADSVYPRVIVKTFGMENLWGNQSRFIAGWIISSTSATSKDCIQKIKITRGTHDGSTAMDFNTDGAGYITIQEPINAGSNTNNSSGFIKDMKVTPFGRLPLSWDGSSSTYEAEKLVTTSSSLMCYPYVGGYYDEGTCGFLYIVMNKTAKDSTYGDISAALSCKPRAIG